MATTDENNNSLSANTNGNEPTKRPEAAVSPASNDKTCMKIAPSETSEAIARSGTDLATGLESIGDTANIAGNAIAVGQSVYELYVTNKIVTNYETARPILNPDTYASRINLVSQGNYDKLAEVASSGSKVKELAEGIGLVSKQLGPVSHILDGIVVGADTAVEYIESDGDISRTAATFTSSVGWNIGAASAAALGGCKAFSWSGPLGCTGGALFGTGLYVIADTGWRDDIVDWGKENIDSLYQKIGDQVFGNNGTQYGKTIPQSSFWVPDGDLEILKDQDGKIVWAGDPNGQYQISWNQDSSGFVTTGDGQHLSFNPDNDVQLEVTTNCGSQATAENCDKIVNVNIYSSEEDTLSSPMAKFEIDALPEEALSVPADPDDLYKVAPGDSLWSIARENNIPFSDILEWNNDLADPNKLQTGQEIRTSPPADNVVSSGFGGEQEDGSYVVRPGDTDGELAEQFGMSTEEFRQVNNIQEDGTIQVGQRLETRTLEEIAQDNTNIDEALDDYFADIDAKAVEGEPAGSQRAETTQAALSQEENAAESADQDAVEAQNKLDVEAGEKVREADLGVMQAQNTFSDAISSGDELSIVKAGLEYYSRLEKRADLGPNGHGSDNGSLGKSNEALLDATTSAIGLGQAIDAGDGWGIAGQSVNLLQDIDKYLNESGSQFKDIISADGSKLLGIGAAGIGLAQAIEADNEWGVVQSSVGILEGIDNYLTPAAKNGAAVASSLDEAFGASAGTTGNVLAGVGSAVGLAMNIAQMDDVFESGNAGAIACTVTSTVSSSINTYNAVAAMAGASGIAGNVVPVLGFVTAGIQLMQGDVVGAAFSAASAAVAMAVACGLMSTGIGAIAGLAIMAIQMLISDNDPPEASATFTLDASGNVVMDIHGDSAMRETAGAYGNSMIALMENYQQNGGRLLIDGSLPSVRVVQGENSAINYRSETGGRTSVVVEDPSQLMKEMSAALYARDRGERIDSAIKVARDVDGKIDFDKVDAIMAGHGFGKTGITYTYGETGSRTAAAWGSGVWHGGGNVGPEGQLFVAKPGDFTSLPLRPEQLPRQQLGEILRIVGLNNFFSGSGSELMTMALGLSGGMLGLTGVAGAQNTVVVTNSEYVKPLDGVEKAKYLQQPNEHAQPEKAATPDFPRLSIPEIADPGTMPQFLTRHWPELLADTLPQPMTSAPGAYLYRETIGYDGLLADGSRAPWWKPAETQAFYRQLVQKEQLDSGFIDKSDASFFGHLVAPEEVERYLQENLPASAVLPEPPPGVATGPMFTMAEDSILRFLPSQLAENTRAGGYGSTEKIFTFVSFGAVQNGRVWLEDNGDIRFAPNPGFVGTGSFVYTVISPSGELVERLATVLVQNVNDPPRLADDSCILPEGEIFYLDRLLVNDTDPEGDPLLLDHFRDVEHGKVAMVNGRLAFIPEEGYHGDIAFTYWVRDHADDYPVMANVTLTYSDVDKGATPTDDRFIIMEDTPLVTSPEKLLANDLEHDGETITFAGLGAAAHGTVAMQPDGSIRFTPEQDYAGTGAGFAYNVQDGSGNIASGWAAVEVLDKREAPTVLSITREPLPEDQILTFSPDEVAKFVHDADGDAVHLEHITNVTGGTIAVRGGYSSFIPNPDYSGPASFDYLANDNHRGTVEGHLQFEIAPVNDAIVCGPDVLATTEDQPVTTTAAQLLANDLDADGSVFAFAGLGAAAHGTAAVDAGGSIAFTPEADYFGDAAGFAYLVEDSEGLASAGWVQVRVAGVGDAPELIADTLTLPEDQPLAFDAATIAGCMKDADGDTITITNIDSAEGGAVSESGGIFTFTPDADYHGPGSVRVTASDGHGETLTAILALDILAVNDPTIFAANLLTTGEGQPLTARVADLLAGAADADGVLEFVSLGDASHGTVAMAAGGTVTFTPEADYFGNAAGFNYLVRDPEGNQATGRVTINVENINDAPEILATTLTSPEDQPILFDAPTIARFIGDPDGDAITLTEITATAGGTISANAGVYTFTPAANFHGPATLGYSATDGHGASLAGVLNLDILSRNDPTSFGVDSFTTLEEQPLVTSVADLMAGDSDPDGDGVLEFVGLGAASHGQVRMTAAGTVEFIPENNYFGEEAGFAYTVRDGEDKEAAGWVKIKVENVNDAPRVAGNRVHIREDEPLRFTTAEVARFITDADGEPLHLDMVTEATGGRIEQSGGVYTFVPDKDFYGEASLAYLAKNDRGEEVNGKLSLAIAPVNDLPETTYLATAGIEDHEITLDSATLMAGATDVEDGTALRFGTIDSSLHGDVHVDPQGMIHFLPDKDFSGSAFFRYQVLDSEGGVGIGYVSAEIAGVNDPPVAMDDEKILAWSNNSYENIYLAATFLANDVDVDLDPLRIVAVGAAEFGTVSVDDAGNIHYIALADDWVGVDTFTYGIADGNGGFSEAAAAIDVKINTSPDVYSELLFTREDIISILAQRDLLANDSDIDGDTMRIVAVDQADHCRVDLQGDGSIRFVPELNFNNLYPGQASFRYTVTDGISDPVTAVAFFDIEPVNDAPILQGERIAGAVEDNSFAFAMTDLLANDTDVEMASPYEEDAIAFAGVWGAGHGRISSDSGTIYYTPNANFCGVETFSYSVVDSHGAGSVVQSEIYVEPVNDYPVVQDEHGEAEDSVWNYYSIDGLLSNDFDVDGDRLTIHSPRVRVGDAEVRISGGDLMLKPAFREDRVIVNYTVSDGHGGEVESELDIMSIREHNFAPTFSGLYAIAWKNSYTVWFNFHAEDKNGGNTWSYDYGDIVAISASAPNVGQITDEGVTFKFKGNTSKASVVLTAVDQGGATGSIYINIANLSKSDGNYIYSPVVLDLDGDGVELQGLAAGVGFDWNLDGEAEGTGWAGKDDGFLVYDYDHDRVVRYAGELALKEYDPGAATDLEGLRAFDTNRDGTFDTRDAEWNSFGVWQDKNSDGLTDEGEFAGLAELTISSLDLQSDENFREQDGNIVYGTTTYWKTDGTAGVLADVGLGGETLELTEVENSTVIDVSAEADPLGELLAESPPRAESEPSAEQPAPSGTDLSAEPTALPAIAALEEQKLEADSPCTSVGGEETSPGSSDMVLSFDDAEINRLCLQLISDMAGSSVDEPVVPAFAGLDIIVPEYVAAPAMEIEHDSLAIV